MGSGKQEGGKVSEPSDLVTKEYRWMTAGVEYVERSKSMSEIGEAEKNRNYSCGGGSLMCEATIYMNHEERRQTSLTIMMMGRNCQILTRSIL